MKLYITVLMLLLSTAVFSQEKDRRAKLDITSKISEISVSPDEKIWLTTAAGNTYYTNSIDSNWHYGKLKPKDDFDIDKPRLSRMSFFNRDTAIITGYIPAKSESSIKNGYFRTTNGGKTWHLLNYGGNAWIYDVFVGNSGRAWIGGSSGNIYHTNDFGETWEKLNSPFNSSSRMYSIFMLNKNEGIAGALANHIYITHDNWKSSKKIPTPFDQKKYENTGSGHTDNEIKKVIVWGDYIVVNQNGHCFYSEKDKIDWKEFDIKIIKFELDQTSQILYVIDDSMNVISFSSPTTFQPLTKQKLQSYPIDLMAVNHTLYIVVGREYNIYKIDADGIIYTIPYTTDIKIPEPDIVQQGKNLTWGITENHIYLSENNDKDWYRIGITEFDVVDFQVLSDSVATLWDGQDNYYFTLHHNTPQLYTPQTPLKSFFDSPITSFSVTSGSQGCFHNRSNEVVYTSNNNSTLTAASLFNKEDWEKDTTTFKNEMNSHLLLEILQDINSNPSAVPTIQDFNITEIDKKNYLEIVDERLKRNDADNIFDRKINKKSYYSVPQILDTLSSTIIKNALDKEEGVWITTSNRFTIQITNQNNDIIKFSKNYYLHIHPWCLSWHVEYKGQHFTCYSIDFSRFINDCISDDFMDKHLFDNRYLMMRIADYLYYKKE